MGKKSRKKRERRAAVPGQGEPTKASVGGARLLDIEAFRQRAERDHAFERDFEAKVTTVREVLQRYRRMDVARALCICDLWPANVASGVKHVFALAILVGLREDAGDSQALTNYVDFRAFLESLFTAWPAFPMLEDFSPEADWGQTRVPLDDQFAPVFYGSSIERIPDFVAAYRITYADNPAALRDMDLAIALQEALIEGMPRLRDAVLPEPAAGHVEVPPEDFWKECMAALASLHAQLAPRPATLSEGLQLTIGAFTAPLKYQSFGDAVLTGSVLPFIAVTDGESWIPLSVRNIPAVMMDHWANRAGAGVPEATHAALARFVSERFRSVHAGPMTPMVGHTIFRELPVSCLISSADGIYLVCACDHAGLEETGRQAERVHQALRAGGPLFMLLPQRQVLALRHEEGEGPGVDDIRIVVVTTQSGTATGMIEPPPLPTRCLPLADFVTIFDSLHDVAELERFWAFADAQQGMLSAMSGGPADLFASFRDTHGVLVDGAIRPTMLMLDTHWGTSWRFRQLVEFWAQAPLLFPDGTLGWKPAANNDRVLRLASRRVPSAAYSVQVGACTVQVVFDLRGMQVEDARMLDMFAQIITDALAETSVQIACAPLLHVPHLVLTCVPAPDSLLAVDQPPGPLSQFTRVVVSAHVSAARQRLEINVLAVQAGLNGATDSAFETRCLTETLEACHAAAGESLPQGLLDALAAAPPRPARYHLQVVRRMVDVPDHVEAIAPLPTQYKEARKELAFAMERAGVAPGRYELAQAKPKIDAGRRGLQQVIEARLAALDRQALARACIEQHDATLAEERVKLQRVRQSLAHAVDYDRTEAVAAARRQFGTLGRNYRFLLEKALSTAGAPGTDHVTDTVLRELVGLVDWYMVLANASDVLHNGVDVGGMQIDDGFVPEVFYAADSTEKEAAFARAYAQSRLGIDEKEADAVQGASAALLADERFRTAFRQDTGFELGNLLRALSIMALAFTHGLGDELALSYTATAEQLAKTFVEHVDGLQPAEAATIVSFLTLSASGIRRLAGRDADEGEVPYWEHNKRVHRYAIRPLVAELDGLRWGAEHASRALLIWNAAVGDGYLPADFRWPQVARFVRHVKEDIETRLEIRTEEVFRRHTSHVARGVDFFRKFANEGFEDAGDFDCLAWWPAQNCLVYVECKYNQPAYAIKDGRRLRDRIYGQSESDPNGQFSHIAARRAFLAKHRARMLEILGWPAPAPVPAQDVEIYVSRETYFWMVNPPYAVPTVFVRIDSLDAWIRNRLGSGAVTPSRPADESVSD